MKKLFFSLAVLAALQITAQPAEQTAQETARSFMRSGDFDNAVLVLNRALQNDKGNLDLQKDLALSFYYKRDYAKALEVVETMLDRNDADIAVYQIGGNVYKALEAVKDAEKMYKKALKKFPKSGALYSEYGELLWAKKNRKPYSFGKRALKKIHLTQVIIIMRLYTTTVQKIKCGALFTARFS
jgi:Tfp pilus assembly protein PilF